MQRSDELAQRHIRAKLIHNIVLQVGYVKSIRIHFNLGTHWASVFEGICISQGVDRVVMNEVADFVSYNPFDHEASVQVLHGLGCSDAILLRHVT